MTKCLYARGDIVIFAIYRKQKQVQQERCGCMVSRVSQVAGWTRVQVAVMLLLPYLILARSLIKYPNRPGDPVEDLSMNSRCRHFFYTRTKLLLKSIIVSMVYVNICNVWPSEHTLLKHAVHLGKKTVPSIMADTYFQIDTCHSMENKRIILP